MTTTAIEFSVPNGLDPKQSLKYQLCLINDTTRETTQKLVNLRTEAIEKRIVARQANITFCQMRKQLQPLIHSLSEISNQDLKIEEEAETQEEGSEDSPTPTTYSASTESGTLPMNHEDQLLTASVADFQSARQHVQQLQTLTTEWLTAYETGVLPSVTATGTTPAAPFILGDKRHPKQFLATVNALQHEIHTHTAFWMRPLIYPKANKEDNYNYDDDDNLDGLSCLGFEKEDDKYVPTGEDVRKDRIFVCGMESMARHVCEQEAMERNDMVVGEAMQLLELLAENSASER
ncbi:hypothetical protein LTR05_007453 [Lithohypha guttulata]|uniref:Uncharacterized protein n=1 Tax=Lithohypha guttulata TaxID=1690604 RepID=A0AAN7SV38_9EURO|nr:hypothetical protein LTR05_007453 [Lithohypha guttulata]